MVTINCDMGEGFGRYRVADDDTLMPLVDLANVACGFHASDPVIMQSTVRLAKRHGVRVGAHPSLPDLQGFGRREMRLSRSEIAAFVRYQIGALNAFLEAEGVALSHVKPHGALYGMAARDREVAEAVCDACETFRVPLLGLAGTLHEDVYSARGMEFVSELYVDLDYGPDGRLLIGGTPLSVEPGAVAKRVREALDLGSIETVEGGRIPVRVDSICVHSDSGHAAETLRSVRAEIGRARGEA